MSLLPNLIKVAWRNIRRNRMYSFINIVGLAVGIACSILILLYVYDEYSYDRFHEKADRIYRLEVDVITSAEVTKLAVSPGPMGPNLTRDFPQIESMVRIMKAGGTLLYKKSTFEVEGFYSDSTFFDVFSFELLEGNPEKALADPTGIVLTQDLAQKIFGDENPLGKSLQLPVRGKEFTLKVTGVAENPPRNSHFTFDMLLSRGVWNSTNNLLHDGDKDWFRSLHYTYLLLSDSSDPALLKAQFPDFLDSHIGEAMKQKGEAYKLSLRPLTDIYLYSHRMSEIEPTSSVKPLYIFAVVAFLILLIACINFTNLATARSLKRAGEVGIRKTIGANRRQVAGQFLGESILVSLIALVIAYFLSYLLFPLFNEFAGKNISNSLFLDGWVILTFIGFGICTGLLAGLYPAFVLSGFKPADVLRGDFSSSNKGLFLRKGLVIFQFIIAVLLITGSAVIYEQLAYTTSRDLGFDSEYMLIFSFSDREQFVEKHKMIKQEIERQTNVIKTAVSGRIPSQPANRQMTTFHLANGEVQRSYTKLYLVGLDFVEAYGMDLLAGQNFSDSYSFIINRSALSRFGIPPNQPEKAVGKKMTQFEFDGRVVGVVEDFNFRTLHEQIKPISLTAYPYAANYLSVKIKAKNLSTTIDKLRSVLQDILTDSEVEHFFLNDYIQRWYEKDQKFGRITLAFTLLSIFIACLGLVGLTGYTVENRAKEIAIRKVAGASIWDILILLFKNFLYLISVATIIAVPIAWYLLQKWLQNFAYHINIGWVPFIISAGILIVLSLGIICWHTLKAEVRNPVRSLRA